MLPHVPDGYVARRPVLDDADALAGLVNFCSMSDAGIMVVSGEQLRGLWQLPFHDVDRDNWVLTSTDGLLVGVATVIAMEPYTDIQSIGVVHPEHEGRGLGAWLMERVEARADELRANAPAGEAVTLRSQTWSGNDRAVALFTSRGYQLERIFRLMQIEFKPDTVLPDITIPAGITIRTFVRGQDESLAWLASEESFRDHWNHHEIPLDVWTNLLIETQESFDPGVWWLAMDGDEVAGVAICDADAPGEPQYGMVATLGVRRPWRGRGIAMALLATTFAEFQRRGKAGVRLGVDADSPTGAYRLYERAGMRTLTDTITYAKGLGLGARG